MGAEDVAWSIRSMIDGSIDVRRKSWVAQRRWRASRCTGPLAVDGASEACGQLRCCSIFRDGLFGVVERGAGKDEGPASGGDGAVSGLCRQVQDKEVIVDAQRRLLGWRAEAIDRGYGLAFRRMRLRVRWS